MSSELQNVFEYSFCVVLSEVFHSLCHGNKDLCHGNKNLCHGNNDLCHGNKDLLEWP